MIPYSDWLAALQTPTPSLNRNTGCFTREKMFISIQTNCYRIIYIINSILCPHCECWRVINPRTRLIKLLCFLHMNSTWVNERVKKTVTGSIYHFFKNHSAHMKDQECFLLVGPQFITNISSWTTHYLLHHLCDHLVFCQHFTFSGIQKWGYLH